MNNTFGSYILAAEVITPSGMNLDIALSVAKADLGRFNQHTHKADCQRYTYAKADFLQQNSLTERLFEMVSILGNALLAPARSSLKPIPLLLSVPESVDKSALQLALEKKAQIKGVASIQLTHQGGASFVNQCIQSLGDHDVILCIAVDSLLEDLESLIDDLKVLNNTNPWGIIPSEGGAGIILATQNGLDTHKIKPVAKLEYFDIERQSQEKCAVMKLDRRAMMRLVRKASQSLPDLGKVYSDMTNSRHDNEDYGFALGARAKCFTQPEQPLLINELWGTLGGGSALALLAVFVAEQDCDTLASLLMFDQNGDRAILALSRCY